ncbi:DHA2 family efflux MFS transporter permease subunit [Micromonospora sp. WMMD882]|uniref:MFS transporter n=1 Tax=Micromonospora sp. WMMD882 TaxID=3015151 RepID=UPI00248B4B8B|nr:DHA2 family efflux MFS transporter permease subunit [Micromonospora sp. WMMD882]WBB78421.1 DHA2 family efflux MFS transporter permease subunit [Micromonospora sp. WMMD882]
MSPRRGLAATIVASSVPMFLVALNNLVVTNALPEIGKDLGASLNELQWVVNAYVLAFAGLQLTAAALGDRLGRRRVFVGGIVVFVAASAACALAGTTELLIAARVVQGIGAAAVFPLSLTLLAAGVPQRRRNLAVGLWGAVSGTAVAVGPLVGGAVTEGLNWQWIFWVNVPIGLAAIGLVYWALAEGRGNGKGLDVLGMLLGGGAVTVAVWAIVEAEGRGWGSPEILGAFGGAALLAVLFVVWERRTRDPLLPLTFYRSRPFVLSNLVSLAMYFGVFGSIFLLVQYLQGPLGYSPLEAGVRTLPWTLMPMFLAPVAGILTSRIGGGPLMALGLALQAGALFWIGALAEPGREYTALIPAMIVAGTGMGLTFAPNSATVLAAVREHEHGKASGANSTVREIGGALGIAVLATVFQQSGGVVGPDPTAGPQAFFDGLVPALYVGAAVVAVGALAGALIRRQKPASGPTATPADAPVSPAVTGTTGSPSSGGSGPLADSGPRETDWARV